MVQLNNFLLLKEGLDTDTFIGNILFFASKILSNHYSLDVYGSKRCCVLDYVESLL